MYVTLPAWVESGPTGARINVARALNLPAPAAARRRGFGAIPQLSEDYCSSAWSLINPVAWLGGCAARDVANVYQEVQYGDAPAPLPPPAPTTQLLTGPDAAAMPGAVYAGDQDGVPVYMVPSTPQQNQLAAVRAQNAAIDQAAAGGWNPAGNLPLNAIDLENLWRDYKVPLMIGGAAIVALVVWKGVSR